MILFRDLLGQAFLALRDNKLRTILSVAGITIGIAAVTIVGTISKSGHEIVFRELQTFGLNSIWISRNRKDVDPFSAGREGTGIVNKDYMAIQEGCCLVRRVTPIVSNSRRSPKLKLHHAGKFSDAKLSGVGVEYLHIVNDTLVEGRRFTRKDISRRRYVALVTREVVDDLFVDNTQVIGKQIHIGKIKFIIVGLLAEKSRDFLSSIGSSGGEDVNNRVLIPFTTYQQILGLNEDISLLQAEAIELDKADVAAKQLVALLNRQHNGVYRYRIQTMKKYIGSANRILGGVSIIGVIAASVSLLVGGMGIMNIMSTSVLERTREIGLRKAVGATSMEIQMQFLSESVLISFTGGILGLIVGILFNEVTAIYTGLHVQLSWESAILSCFVALSVGILSGYYPAKRAASMLPVNALRYE